MSLIISDQSAQPEIMIIFYNYNFNLDQSIDIQKLFHRYF
jgi:hypothetical protein